MLMATVGPGAGIAPLDAWGGQAEIGDRAEISMFLMIMEQTSRGSGHSA